jgi:hypothetical protein
MDNRLTCEFDGGTVDGLLGHSLPDRLALDREEVDEFA